MDTNSIAQTTHRHTPTPRQQRAAQLAAAGHVCEPVGYADRWQVVSSDGSTRYDVTDQGANVYTCTCPDAQRGNECKHIWAVRVWRRAVAKAEEADAAGRLSELEQYTRQKASAWSQFSLDTLAILARACRHVRERSAPAYTAFDLIPAARPQDWDAVRAAPQEEERVSWGSQHDELFGSYTPHPFAVRS